jgi:hypothetical protein
MEIILFDDNLEEILLITKSPIEVNDNIIKFSTDIDLDPFKEYKLLNYIQHDRTGRIIRSLFLTISKMINFITIGSSYEYTFSYKDMKDFYIDQPVYNNEYHSYLKSIKRDIKLSKLLQ